jgi:hypothetical protein
MSGPAARTNFPLSNSSAGGAGAAATLSPTLRAKLEKCCTESLSKHPAQQVVGANASGAEPNGGGQEQGVKAEGEAEAGDGDGDGEEYIEEMIRELTYYGPVEIQHTASSGSSVTGPGASSACSSSVIG